MKFIKGISLELPLIFLENEKKEINFFFKWYSTCQYNAYNNFFYLKCFLEIRKKYLNPIIGEIMNTSNFLIKIKVKEKTNIIHNIFFFLKLKKVLKFRKFFDFQYSSSVNHDYLSQKKNFDEIKKKDFKNLFKKRVIPIDLIPFFFSKGCEILKNIPQRINLWNFLKINFNIRNLNKNFPEMTVDAKLEIDARSLQFKNNVTGKHFINFQTEKNPKLPLNAFKKKLFFAPFFAIGFIIKLFKKRPIWTLEILEKFFPSTLMRYLKKILPCLSYSFQGINPFQKAWIRLNFDPRKKKSVLIYQTFEIKKKNAKLNQNHSCWTQICDVSKIKIKQFIAEKRKNVFFRKKFIHLLTGWFSCWEFNGLKQNLKLLQ